MNKTVQLNSQQSTLIVCLNPMPEILYWGERLEPLNEQELVQFQLMTERGLMQARIDEDVPLSLCPELGRANFGSPGLEAHREGKSWAPQFIYDSHQINAQTLSIKCQDIVASIELQIALTLDDDSSVLAKSIKVINRDSTPLTVNKLALTFPLPYQANQVMSFHGRWSRELQSQRVRLDHGQFIQENRRGRTSHEYFPSCLIGEENFSEEKGDVWGFHLAWSGNHAWKAEVKSDGRRLMQAGELLLPGEVILKQNESYQTPTLYIAHSRSGINGLRTKFHPFIRQHLIRFDRHKVRPVHLNTWEGIYFDHNPSYLSEMISEAAKIGVERFIIDDGWFKGRNNDKAALGDWLVDKNKYPQGLTPLIKQVNELGMEFGLWVEPEMFNPDSDLFRTHPEWLLASEGYSAVTGRNQYVLDLQNSECFDYLYSALNQILSDHHIGYLKWDMNREIVQASHLGRAAVNGQTQALYKFLSKLNQSHPEVEIESCSSGGGRMDFEILRYACRFWTSDCNDALERQTIQRNMSIFFPPELMGAHIGPEKSHTTRRRHDIHFRGITALFGHMGVELDPVAESESEKQAFKHYIELHKQFRPLLHSGQSFFLDSRDHSRHAYGVFDKQQTLVAIAQLAMPEYMLMEPLKLGMLESDGDYRVSMVHFPHSSRGLMKRQPDWTQEQTIVVKGCWLKNVGLSLPILDPESAMLIHIEKSH
ncbi:alpha-galactosidase [Vibrio sp. ZSDE26]|uniref:Alpha-galactosidase n=1 Tax=Vibrio amylolyticus TaxID=2847292 RepID=A0A9X2BII6_9VIBR|nr:alpha-galactosidase [Vibrio amylolyticus]MCK6262477.1 alpha-galactosidase [Vibrio amylolyticus]